MCERCQEMAGRVFFAGDYEEGVTAPPFHPNCDCSTREYWGELPEGVAEKPIPSQPDDLGERTENNIAALHPDIQEAARMALYEMQQELGDVRIVEAYRSKEKQDADYERGATTVRGGYSYHQYGLAFDIGFFDEDGKYLTEVDWAFFERAGEIGRKYGFEWGGDWSSFVDPPHFQMVYGYTCAELIDMQLYGESDYLRQLDPSRRNLQQP